MLVFHPNVTSFEKVLLSQLTWAETEIWICFETASLDFYFLIVLAFCLFPDPSCLIVSVVFFAYPSPLAV